MQAKSILSNFMLTATSMVGSRILRFWYVGWVVQHLGVASWGQLAFAITLLAFLSLLVEGGKATRATLWKVDQKEGDQEAAQQLIWVRFIWSIPVFLVLQASLWLFPFEGSGVVGLYAFWLLLRPFTLDWLYNRHHLSGIPQFVQLVRNIFLLVGVYVLQPQSIGIVAIIEVALELLTIIILFTVIRKKVPPLQWDFKLQHGWTTLLASAPLLVSSLFSLLHQNGDLLLIRSFMDTQSVGIYDFTYKIMLFVFYAGGGLTLALRSRLAREKLRDPSGNSQLRLLMPAQRLLLVGALLYLVGVWFMAWPILQHFIPQHAVEAQNVLRIVSFYIPFAFFNIPLVEWLLVNYPAKKFAWLTFYMGIGNLLLNLWMIPLAGLIGAAISTVIIELCAAIYVWLLAQKQGMYLKPNLGALILGIALVAIPSLAPISGNQPGQGGIAMLLVIGFSWWSGLFRRADLVALSGRE